MKALVTGAAGFVGSNLVDRLLAEGYEVAGFDNFSTGRMEFLSDALASPRFSLHRGDLLDSASLQAAMAGAGTVFHLAANADVRYGTTNPRKDLEQNTIGTANVLEAMRACGVKRIAFASSGSVYGEPEVFPTPENAPFPLQTSLYGASKLAAEGLIEAYCEGFGIEACIFRFVSILGERYSHGHVFDFYRSLRHNPGELQVLGDGKQRKSYLYVQDCIDAVLTAWRRTGRARVEVYNVGADEYCEVNDSVRWICERLGVRPRLLYSGGSRGWVGDSPFIFLDCKKLRALGWTPKTSIRTGVLRTVAYLEQNPWLLEARCLP
jgi:UDP-glucose 4-epimerase